MKTSLKILLFPFLLMAGISLACAISVPRAYIPQPSATFFPSSVPATMAVIQVPSNIVDEQTLLVNLYSRVNPSVVNITIYATSGGVMGRVAQGSGFVYDTDRHVVTNDHVVEGAEQIEVTFSDGSISRSTLIGSDLYSDLAVVQVEKIPAGVQPLPLADMKQVAVGQTVLAVGNPFGLEGTLTRGIVSAMGREIPSLVGQFYIPLAIQTDAAINPGNSGGPLLNLQGEVVGINAQIETGGTSQANTGVGFAIPVSILQRVVPDLVKNGKTEWAYLGVRMNDVNPDIQEAMNLPVDRGAYIADVTSDGPAVTAGLHGSNDTKTINQRTVDVGGDIITAVDGQPIHSSDDLLVFLALNKRPGDEAVLTIVRDGKTQTLTVRLAPRPLGSSINTIP